MKPARPFIVSRFAVSVTLLISGLVLAFAPTASCHPWHAHDIPPPGPEREALRQEVLREWVRSPQDLGTPLPALQQPVMLASNVTGVSALRLALNAVAAAGGAPPQASAFGKFPKLQLRWDGDFLYVGSNGLPDHNMMVGITNWQQQVPLPQAYFGANAWRLPLHPTPAAQSLSIKGRFLRGAVALAVNGIPIFNPQNNRGEISQEIGELDQWGGHCGRADDYHYHVVPLHLQNVVGKGLPIAYALDGYPIYGLVEPDGSQVGKLDECSGHDLPGLGYHYHASSKYPYVMAGFHGKVEEHEQQVDPQPRANPVRPALPPLKGARITSYSTTAEGRVRSLAYTVNGKQGAVNYADMGNGEWKFQFVSTDGSKQEQTYQSRDRQGGGSSPRGGERPPRRDDQEGGPPGRGGPRPGREEPQAASSFGPDALKKPNASFILTSPEVSNRGDLPMQFTGDGDGATLPLSWHGAPAGTRSYALIMDHLAPGNVMKSYWVMWDIPSTVTSLPKNVQGVGKVGISFKGQQGYEPPHSQGPGKKTYGLTVYALSEPPAIPQKSDTVTRDTLLAAIQGKVLASASLEVNYTRGGGNRPGTEPSPRRGSRDDNRAEAPPSRPEPPKAPQLGDKPPRAGKGAADAKGLIKPTMADTVHVDVYADNWFAMFINGELVAVDSIKFTPHNVQSFDILPEYPMTIAVLAKDNAHPKTGMEYGDHIGDGGFIVKFSDGTVSNSQWKAMNFFKGPLNHETTNPVVVHTPIPDGWWKADFDDSKWPSATEFTEERVNPKEPFHQVDFSGAKFIWSGDLDLDNTVIFRVRIEKPGWEPRWNTHADLDISGAPFK